MNNDKIKILDDRSQAREKLPIWYGSRDNHVHGVKELIANSADELKNNASEPGEIIVKLYDNDNKILVRDNGRGIKIDGKTDGYDNYYLLFQKLFAGTKYDVTDSITTGTNGVGTTVLNYTSKEFKVRSWYDGKCHSVRFENGGELDENGLVIEKLSENEKHLHGTEVSVLLDEDVYTKTKFKDEIINNIVKHFAVPALNIKFTYIHDDGENETVKEYCYESYKEYLEEVSSGVLTSQIFSLGNLKFDKDVEMTYKEGNVTVKESNSYDVFIASMTDPIQESYLNMTYLSEGGSINKGVLDGVRLYLNKYCRDNKLFPKGVTYFKPIDVEESIGFLVITESNNVEFSNQTKLSTNKLLYEEDIKTYINNLLDAISIEKPKEFKKMVDHLLEVQKSNSRADASRNKLKKKLKEKVEGIGNKIKKLIDCEVHGEKAELFITEGDSANGSIVDARDDEYQAAYPLRGKLINTLKANDDKIFKNQEIIDMVKIIGTGITDSRKKKNDFEIHKARFGKIIITTDADPDGAQIASLVLVFIYRFMRPLLDAGMVYVAQTPLYELKFEDDSVVYFLSEDEKNKKIGDYADRKYVINRLKGLGEVDADTMHYTTLNPETRNIIRLTVEDAEIVEKMILDWMDTDVEPRKDMISTQLPSFLLSE